MQRAAAKVNAQTRLSVCESECQSEWQTVAEGGQARHLIATCFPGHAKRLPPFIFPPPCICFKIPPSLFSDVSMLEFPLADFHFVLRVFRAIGRLSLFAGLRLGVAHLVGSEKPMFTHMHSAAKVLRYAALFRLLMLLIHTTMDAMKNDQNDQNNRGHRRSPIGTPTAHRGQSLPWCDLDLRSRWSMRPHSLLLVL